ncbi:MAG: FecR domain-containing protein [Clostridia bacterium]|nr:FecR domain-containing protein [Clostridia bacterium]
MKKRFELVFVVVFLLSQFTATVVADDEVKSLKEGFSLYGLTGEVSYIEKMPYEGFLQLETLNQLRFEFDSNGNMTPISQSFSFGQGIFPENFDLGDITITKMGTTIGATGYLDEKHIINIEYQFYIDMAYYYEDGSGHTITTTLHYQMEDGTISGMYGIDNYHKLKPALYDITITGNNFNIDFVKDFGDGTDPVESSKHSSLGLLHSLKMTLEGVVLDVPEKVDSDIRFSALAGEVQVVSAEDLDDEAWEMGMLDMILYVDDHIKTGSGDSFAILSLSDMTTFTMKPQTEIVLSLPPEESKLAIVSGKVWVNVQRAMKGQSLEVDMSQAVAGIKGTTFTVEESNGLSIISLYEGELEITEKATGNKTTLLGGESIALQNGVVVNRVNFDRSAALSEWAGYDVMVHERSLEDFVQSISVEQESDDVVTTTDASASGTDGVVSEMTSTTDPVVEESVPAENNQILPQEESRNEEKNESSSFLVIALALGITLILAVVILSRKKKNNS